MFFEKEHLTGSNYDWHEDYNPAKFAGTPDRRLFDRFDGNQLLYMINSFGESIGNLTVDDGQRIEKMILTELPLDIKSQIGVFNWLKGRYLYYWS
ncbi:MAG: hypothetical protein JWN76_1627 [Chitinophagaceae bacterium]|nr:hypothetical protein [Chitinophagaceae bacterium]